jgi:hypothetical protein
VCILLYLSEADWQFEDGMSVNYTDWCPGEPNSEPNENCVHLWGGCGSKWNNINCKATMGYACEIPSSPEPTTEPTLEPTTQAPVTPVTGCPSSEWQSFEGSCYLHVDGSWTYDQAIASCPSRAAGAHLATISSSEENAFVHAQGLNSSAWIGISSETNYNLCGCQFSLIFPEGPSWSWEDGSALSYENWADGEPNNLDTEKCVLIQQVSGYSMEWNNVDCDARFGYHCEAPRPGNKP